MSRRSLRRWASTMRSSRRSKEVPASITSPAAVARRLRETWVSDRWPADSVARSGSRAGLARPQAHVRILRHAASELICPGSPGPDRLAKPGDAETQIRPAILRRVHGPPTSGWKTEFELVITAGVSDQKTDALSGHAGCAGVAPLQENFEHAVTVQIDRLGARSDIAAVGIFETGPIGRNGKHAFDRVEGSGLVPS